MDRSAAIVGAMLGLTCGDALGFTREGLSRRRAERLYGLAPLQLRGFGAGCTSDDTEHACMTAQALLSSGGDPERFARDLASRLRCWLIGVPDGRATIRACVKLWLGFPPDRSGVFSAGNGPAMRAPLLGVYESQDLQHLKDLVRASTRITHSDPRAEEGALAVALAAAYAMREGAEGLRRPEALSSFVRPHLQGHELLSHLQRAEESLAHGIRVCDFADTLGLANGVTGYINHTVPVALYAWLSAPDDFRKAVESVVVLGGDTDTTGAVVGALAGATLGPQAIPDEWLNGIREWPRTVGWIRSLAAALASAKKGTPVMAPRLSWPAVALRNTKYLAMMLGLGLRRMLPPY